MADARDPLDPPLDDEALREAADLALGPEPAPRSPRQMTPEGQLERDLRDRARAIRHAGLRSPRDPTLTDAVDWRKRQAFLVALAETGLIGVAIARSGWNRQSAHADRKADREFAAMWDEALETAADIAEAEAARRGIVGWREPVYFKGVQCGEVMRFSDKMLEMTLKARRPERFRERHDVSAEVKGGVLVVPGVPGATAWEAAADAGQAAHRSKDEG